MIKMLDPTSNKSILGDPVQVQVGTTTALTVSAIPGVWTHAMGLESLFCVLRQQTVPSQ